MSRKRILLIGKDGQVGGELLTRLPPLGELSVIDYPEIDLAEADSIQAQLKSAEPDIVVNAAAYTAVDQAESEEAKAQRINAEAPRQLAEWAARHKALLIHYSTDYVYDGFKSSPYVETDAPNPLNVYGRTKLAGDEAILNSGCDHFILRTSWVYGVRGRNFLHTVLRLVRERDEVGIVDDQVGSPTSSAWLAEETCEVLRQWLVREDSLQCGLYHLTTAGKTTWYRFARAILEEMLLSDELSKLRPIPTDQYPTPARRPRCSVLSHEKIRVQFGIQPPDWRTALRWVVEELRAKE